MKRNVLLEQMRDHARDWAKLTIARNLLTEARRKFEKERQPDVIQHAQTFFGQITDGRYQQVYAPLGEQKITVTDSNAIVKTPSQLSRGTREQVFLVAQVRADKRARGSEQNRCQCSWTK